MAEQGRAAPRWLWSILAVYTLLALAMSLTVPLGESPDELDHFLYLRYLANERAFPPLSAVAAENPTMEANQPPLYYALGAAFVGWVDMREPLELAQNECFSFDPADRGSPDVLCAQRARSAAIRRHASGLPFGPRFLGAAGRAGDRVGLPFGPPRRAERTAGGAAGRGAAGF